MDRVAARGEFLAEFGSHDAATAGSGINSYADVHRKSRRIAFIVWEDASLSLRFSSSKYGRAGMRFIAQKIERQATLAIACLYLNLTHLLRGGASEGGSIKLVSEISNDSCNELQNHCLANCVCASNPL